MDRDNRTRTGAKDPWGRAAPMPLAQRLAEARPGPDTEPDQHVVGKRAKGRYKPRAEAGMPGAGLTAEAFGKVRPDRLALKPYRGKPAVRNFREGDGNVGIIRSPVRAIAPPDFRGRLRPAGGPEPSRRPYPRGLQRDGGRAAKTAGRRRAATRHVRDVKGLRVFPHPSLPAESPRSNTLPSPQREEA